MPQYEVCLYTQAFHTETVTADSEADAVDKVMDTTDESDFYTDQRHLEYVKEGK